MPKIRELTLQDEAGYKTWLQAWQNEPTQVSVSQPLGTSFLAFINQLKINRTQPKLPRVPATKYFYIEDNIIKGGISCRWELNDYLAKYGGNIGYGVAPAYRKQGIATEMLRQAVKLFQQRHLDKVLITAEDWNVASQRVIESAGGVYENTLIEESTGYRLKRYWIDLTT